MNRQDRDGRGPTAGVGRPAAAVPAGAAAPGAARAAEAPKDLAALIARLPAADVEAAEQVCKELLAGGAAAVEKLVNSVGEEFGDPSGVKATYALHGLAHYVCRPGAPPAERRMLAETLARCLQAEHGPELKAFIARQLQFCGRSDEVPALGRLLGDERLCEPAAQALVAIGGDSAVAAIREALARARGPTRVTLLLALARLRDRGVAGSARPAAGDADREVRLAALHALGSVGDADAAEIVLKAAETESPYERTQAVEACLLLARRLAEQGKTQQAEKVLRKLLAGPAAGSFQVRCAALHDLATVLGAGAADDVLAAMDSKDLRTRVPAARTALKLAKGVAASDKAVCQRLLRKVVESGEEAAVVHEAKELLAAAGG